MAKSYSIDTQQDLSSRDRALRSLDILVGTWEVSGEAHGQVTFEWMEGERFLIQKADLGAAKGIEIIGYDEESWALKSHYFDRSGDILEYIYAVDGDNFTVSLNMQDREGAFRARFSNGGNTISGRWDWTEDGRRLGYAATLTRVSE